MGQIIKLNFLELSLQNFSFPVYRKIYEDGDKSDTVFRYRLPISVESAEYTEFSVSFTQIENFELFCCKENYNTSLTEYYLFRLLLNKVDNQNLDYKKGKKFYDKNIDIITQKHQKGNEIISLMPYYLKSKKLFGFLIDFQFKVNSGYTLDKEVLRLSLSKHCREKIKVHNNTAEEFLLNEMTANFFVDNKYISNDNDSPF